MEKSYVLICWDGDGSIFDSHYICCPEEEVGKRAASYLRHWRYYAAQHDMEEIDKPSICEIWRLETDTSMKLYAKVFAA